MVSGIIILDEKPKHTKMSLFKQLFLFNLILSIVSCTQHPSGTEDKATQEQNKQAFIETLEKHLRAVSEKDLPSLKSTMSPDGNMQLILPGVEILFSVESFMNYHEEWFQDTSWTFETKILNTDIGDKIGLATTEIVYREPDRNGKPYFNRMIVSYGLEKIDGQWYVIKDHASSIEKSTD